MHEAKVDGKMFAVFCHIHWRLCVEGSVQRILHLY